MKISRKGTLIIYQLFGVYRGRVHHYFTISKNYYGYYGTRKKYTLKQLYTKYIINIHA